MKFKDTAMGLLQSRSVRWYTILQAVVLLAQPYLTKYGVDPVLFNTATGIVAVIILRMITKVSLAEKGSGLGKLKEVLENTEEIFNDPVYRALLDSFLKDRGVDIKFPEPKTYVKQVKINDKFYDLMSDGSYIPSKHVPSKIPITY